MRAVRGGQVVNRGTVEEPRQTPRNLHYLRLQRSLLCRKWGSLCAPLSFLFFPPPTSFLFFLYFFLSFFPFFPPRCVRTRTPDPFHSSSRLPFREAVNREKGRGRGEWYKEGETLARSFLRLRKFSSNFGGQMKGGTKGCGGGVRESGPRGRRGPRRDGIMSPRAEPPLARSGSRRKEAEKGRGDNGPFKKSLNRELVSSGGPPRLSLFLDDTLLLPVLVPLSLALPWSHRLVTADWLNSLKPGKPAAIYLSAYAGKFFSSLSLSLSLSLSQFYSRGVVRTPIF